MVKENMSQVTYEKILSLQFAFWQVGKEFREII